MNGTTASASDDGAGVTEGDEGGPSFPRGPACAGAALPDLLTRIYADGPRAGDALSGVGTAAS